MGIWALFLVILTLIETIKQGLLRNPMIKFLSEPDYVNHQNKVQTASLISNIVFSVLVIILILSGGQILTSLAEFTRTPATSFMGNLQRS